jgi:hypothetical protein
MGGFEGFSNVVAWGGGGGYPICSTWIELSTLPKLCKAQISIQTADLDRVQYCILFKSVLYWYLFCFFLQELDMKGNPFCVGSVGTAAAKRRILLSTSIILNDGFVFCLVLFKSWGHLLYWQFKTVYILHIPPGVTFNNSTFCPHCIYVFCVGLRTNSHYFPIQH